MARLNKAYKERLEKIFKKQGYVLRYERGNFRSGWCILENSEVIVINKFLPLESKIIALQDVVREVPINMDDLDPKDKKIIDDLKQTEIKF